MMDNRCRSPRYNTRSYDDPVDDDRVWYQVRLADGFLAYRSTNEQKARDCLARHPGASFEVIGALGDDEVLPPGVPVSTVAVPGDRL